MSKLSNKNIITAPIQRKTKLNDYVFKTKRVEIDINKTYDIGLVLGCSVRSILNKRTLDAINLYNEGIINTIYLSGGVGKTSTHRTETEAEVMKRIMLEHGIPESDIVIEGESTTTRENMVNILKLVRNNCGNDSSIVLITSDFHQKRAKAMLEKMLEEIGSSISIYSYGVVDGKYDIDNWQKSFRSQKLLRTEALLLSYYVWNKTIKDQEVEKIDVRTRK